MEIVDDLKWKFTINYHFIRIDDSMVKFQLFTNQFLKFENGQFFDLFINILNMNLAQNFVA